MRTIIHSDLDSVYFPVNDITIFAEFFLILNKRDLPSSRLVVSDFQWPLDECNIAEQVEDEELKWHHVFQFPGEAEYFFRADILWKLTVVKMTKTAKKSVFIEAIVKSKFCNGCCDYGYHEQIACNTIL